MVKIKKVTKTIAEAISTEMTEAKFGGRKKKYQHDVDDYVLELIQRYIPADLRSTFKLYDSYIKKTSLIQFSKKGENKKPPKTICCGIFVPYYQPIEISEADYNVLLDLDGAKWDYYTCATTYKEKLEKLIYDLTFPEAIVQKIPYSKEYVAKYFPTIENELENIEKLAEKA